MKNTLSTFLKVPLLDGCFHIFYEHINILCKLFRFPQCYFKCTVDTRDEHAPNFSCPGTECLILKKKLEILMYSPKLCYTATKFLQIIHFFSTSNLMEIKQYLFFVAHSWISKNWACVKITYYYYWPLINQKSNKFAYLIRTTYVNIKYITHNL